MIKKFNLKIKKYLTGLKGTIFRYISLTAIIPLIIILPATYFISRYILLESIKQNMKNSVHFIVKMCETQREDIDKKLNEDIEKGYRILKKEFSRYDDISQLEETTELTVKNQSTGEETTIQLPRMVSGKTGFLKNFNIVDSIASEIGIRGTTTTIFQLQDDKLIRIATNVKNKEGKRAILTYIPKESLVFRTIIQNKDYRGRAMVVESWNITHYTPIKANNGKIVGAIYVGIPAPKSAIFDVIKETKIGPTGYVYVMNSMGQAIEHPTMKGASVINLTDPTTNKPFVQDIINQKEGFFTYNFPDSTGTIKEKIAYSSYYQNWDWIIVATSNTDDLLLKLSIMFTIIVSLLIGMPLILFFVSSLAANRIFTPLKKIIDVTVKVSSGDIRVFIPQPHYQKCVQVKNCEKRECPAYESRNRSCWRIDGTLCDHEQGEDADSRSKLEICCDCEVYQSAIRNETDELIEAINNMIVTISNILLNIKIVGDELSKESASLTEISSVMEHESQNQAAFIEETTSSNEELMATIENVANSAKNQAEKVSQTSAAMEELTSSTKVVGDNSTKVSAEAKESVKRAHDTEGMLQDTTISINQVAEGSKRIVDIVAMINDISDQINLLSLNAAIEAARAGEHGKGFAVVSEEISKLAEATAQSTKEIESVISTSRADIQKGAQLVNKTVASITDMIKKIEIAAQLFEEIALSSDEQIRGSEQVMLDVEEINKMADQIAMATGEQKVTSTEILNALTRVNNSVQEIASSSQTVSESAHSLQEKADKLHEIIKRFKI